MKASISILRRQLGSRVTRIVFDLGIVIFAIITFTHMATSKRAPQVGQLNS